NYDLKNDKNIDYKERDKENIESQKTSKRKTRKDAVLVNELKVKSERDFFKKMDPGEQKRYNEERNKSLSERYEKKNITKVTVKNYLTNDKANKIIHMQQFIMMSKPLTCI